MKKTNLKKIALIVAAVLIAGVSIFANALVGNPISKWIATNRAEEHLVKEYNENDFEIDEVSYSFKDSCYHVFIKSPSSEDSNFTIVLDMFGKIRFDTYKDNVLSGRNTAERIGTEYREKVDAVLNSKTFPYTEEIGFGEIEFIERAYKDYADVSEYAIITEELTLDAFYDISELGGRAGNITFYLDGENVTYEKAAEIILDIREIFDAAGVKFHTLDFVFENPENENERIETIKLLYTDIYKDGMVKRVKVYDEKAKAYWAEKDAEK